MMKGGLQSDRAHAVSSKKAQCGCFALWDTNALVIH